MNFNLISYLHRHKTFSSETFGPGERLAGVLAHIRKELVEVEQAPKDLSEWADVVILAMDGALRQGFEPKEICDALEAKYLKNSTRTWPDWRGVGEDQPIEHLEMDGVGVPRVELAEIPAPYGLVTELDSVALHLVLTAFHNGEDAVSFDVEEAPGLPDEIAPTELPNPKGLHSKRKSSTRRG
jgi:hypothetical protein